MLKNIKLPVIFTMKNEITRNNVKHNENAIRKSCTEKLYSDE